MNAAQGGSYTESISRTSVPTGVSIDTADQGATNCGAPAASLFTANGFLINCAATGVATNCRAGGNYTLSF